MSVEGSASLVIECDRSRLRQMMLNVLGNAVKFTTEGSITATTKPSDDGGVCIYIADTGPGIPEQDIERIFESFFQSEAALARTPRASEGAGLGLAITRMLAELHGGEVRIESTLGKGTAVTIGLPAHPPEHHQGGRDEQ
jgi:signal transduction histidine kinase